MFTLTYINKFTHHVEEFEYRSYDAAENIARIKKLQYYVIQGVV